MLQKVWQKALKPQTLSSVNFQLSSGEEINLNSGFRQSSNARIKASVSIGDPSRPAGVWRLQDTINFLWSLVELSSSTGGTRLNMEGWQMGGVSFGEKGTVGRTLGGIPGESSSRGAHMGKTRFVPGIAPRRPMGLEQNFFSSWELRLEG